jgi:hypothetical protein
MTVSTSSLPMRLGLRELGKIKNSLNSNLVILRVTYQHSFMVKPHSLAIDWGRNPVWEGVMAAPSVFANSFTMSSVNFASTTTTIIFQRSKMDHRHRRRSRSPSRRIYPSHSDSYRPSDQSRASPRRRQTLLQTQLRTKPPSQIQLFKCWRNELLLIQI